MRQRLFLFCVAMDLRVGVYVRDGGRWAVNLNNRIFFFCMIALLPTRERPAVDPRKIHGKVRAGIILRIVLFWAMNVCAYVGL